MGISVYTSFIVEGYQKYYATSTRTRKVLLTAETAANLVLDGTKNVEGNPFSTLSSAGS